jgi:putative FmdB family regulatory protein
MPIFEYLCQACQHRFDVLQKIDAPAPACPDCGRPGVEKLLSAPSFHLQGKGWRKNAAPQGKDGAPRAPRKVGHMLDSGAPHSHDDDPGRDRRRPVVEPPAPAPSHGHAHGHSHDATPPGHPHGHKHDHKH